MYKHDAVSSRPHSVSYLNVLLYGHRAISCQVDKLKQAHITSGYPQSGNTGSTLRCLTYIIDSGCKLHQFVWADVWTVGKAKIE